MPRACFPDPGEVAERFMAAVLKTVVAQVTGGSNPSLSAIKTGPGVAQVNTWGGARVVEWGRLLSG